MNFNSKLTYISGLRANMPSAQNSKRSHKSPIFQRVCPLKPSQIPWEIIAGITFATFAIQEVMGCTKIAGMPLVTGIYIILLPMVSFAIFGLSRHLTIGTDSATAEILASGLVALAIPESSKYVAYAGMIALLQRPCFSLEAG
jgi:MFS superfamily sulfate permease-like transporter